MVWVLLVALLFALAAIVWLVVARPHSEPRMAGLTYTPATPTRKAEPRSEPALPRLLDHATGVKILEALERLNTRFDEARKETRRDHSVQADMLFMLDGIRAQLAHLATRENQMAKTIAEWGADLQAQVDKQEAELAQTSDTVTVIEQLVDGNLAQITALTQQVKDLQATSADPTVLQPVLDDLVRLQTIQKATRERLVAAALKGTPADPNA